MKFKHTFHVFVDNFSVTYKQLLYRLVVGLVAGLICFASIYPFASDMLASDSFRTLYDGVKDFFFQFINGNMSELRDISGKIQKAYSEFLNLLQTRMVQLVLSGLLILFIYIVEKWFAGLGNYATASVINDKMALRADSPFMGTLIGTLKKSAVYNAIYVPLSVLYDCLVAVAMFFFVYFLVVHNVLPLLIGIFFFVLIAVIALAFKMTFTTDWLPALVRGKMKQGEAFKYTFSRKGKRTLNVLSNFVVLILIIFALNVCAILFTFGVGGLLTVPASYVVLVSFELVNYYDREKIKYSIDKNTIISPAKEKPVTREEFFRGDE